jgi:hypothetical protein
MKKRRLEEMYLQSMNDRVAEDQEKEICRKLLAELLGHDPIQQGHKKCARNMSRR